MAKRKYSVVDRGTFYKSEAYKKAKMARQARYIRPAALVPELKSIDVKSEAAFSQGSPVILCLNAIGAGTDINQRVGRKVKLNSLQSTLSLQSNIDGGGGKCRAALVYDRQPNGSPPVYTDIFSNEAAGSDAWTGINLKNRDRFKILRDYKMNLIGTNVAPWSPFQMEFHQDYIKLGLDEVFGNGDDDTGAIQSGALWAVFYTEDSTALSGNYQIETRVRYTDM